MAVAEREISPEEKLLKVIQEGGEAGKSQTPEEKLLSTVQPTSQPTSPRGSSPRTEAAAGQAVAPGKSGGGEQNAAAPRIVGAAPAAAQIPPKPAPVVSPPPAKPSAPVAQAEPLKKTGAVKPAEPAPPAPKKKEDKPGPEAKAATPEPEEKLKLKILKPEAAAEGKGPAAKAMIGVSAPSSSGVDVSVPGINSKRPARKFSVGTLNRAMAAAVVLLLGLTAYEIWAGVRAFETSRLRQEATSGQGSQRSGVSNQKSGVNKGDGMGVLPKQDSQGMGALLSDIVDLWKLRGDVFNHGGTVVVELQQNQVTKIEPVGPLAARLKLMGFSRPPGEETKAILWDSKDAKMFIARNGEKILVGAQPLELIEIQRDYVVLSDGKEKVSVK